MEAQPRRFGFGTIAMLVLTAIFVPLYLWTAISGFVPHHFSGMLFSNRTGRVYVVYRAEPAGLAGVTVGDRALDLPHGNVLLGLQIYSSERDIRVATARGIVLVHPALAREPVGTAIASCVLHLSAVVLIAFAALLYVRRRGVMAFAFWLWAIMLPGDNDVVVAVYWLPDAIALPIDLLFSAFSLSALALIPFALRFPDGRLSARVRWLDAAAWTVFACGGIAFAVLEAMSLGGTWGDSGQAQSTLYVPALSLLVVAAILIWRYVGSDAPERAKTAWAITGFMGSVLAQGAVLAVYYFTYFDPGPATAFGLAPYIATRYFDALADLFPLLAIYPILRYRLFDLGFALNRAALYSILTLAAVATLAGVNWLAQHFVTERLALVMQPIAAIVIGLGYLRVRGWTQAFLERTLFRERFAAEKQIDATIRGFPLAERPGAIDESLGAEAADVLSLQSAAVFRLEGAGLVRAASIGWDDACLDALQRDDRLVRRLLTDGPASRLDAIHWSPAGLPAPPREPVVAIVLAHAGALCGVAFYGRHRNGTEIDPEEMALLRRLCEAAAVAYQMAEMRAELAELRQLRLVLKPEPA